jgi:hypothetical protein
MGHGPGRLPIQHEQIQPAVGVELQMLFAVEHEGFGRAAEAPICEHQSAFPVTASHASTF